MTRVVICGAGIAGISTAFHLTRAGITDIVIADPRPPLTLTSDKSTECYRNWWPSPPMVALMNRSIDLLDRYATESGNVFGLNRRGYLYVTGSAHNLATIAEGARRAEAAGAGELRVHAGDGSTYEPDAVAGADLFVSGDGLHQHFPFITAAAVGGLHVRTAGWLSAQQLGMWMLEQAEEAGATLVRAEVRAVDVVDSRVTSVRIDDSDVPTGAFVNAAGPMVDHVGSMLGVDLPVFSELHSKVAFRDHTTALPRSAPMVIWTDPQKVQWSDDELAALTAEGREDLMRELPPGCHARPEGAEGSPWVLGLWEYPAQRIEPVWPLPHDPLYAEVVLRGLTTMVPGFGAYADRLPESSTDGGYYTKTPENLPLAGPAGPDGSYVCGALSGFGIMAACAVGELVATHIGGGPLPEWAKWFELHRYQDPALVAAMARFGDTGQL